jgi:uncharacterized protein YbaP (TraB family)
MLRKLASLLLLTFSSSAFCMDMSLPPAHAVGSGTAFKAAATPRRGALYRVQHAGKTSYLFGTIHVGTQAFFPLEPEVTQALADSSALVLEIDVRASEPFQRAVAKYGHYPAGQSVRDHLSPLALDKLRAALAHAGLPLSAVEQCRPWLLANILVGTEIDKQGYQHSLGVESYLLSTASKQKKPLRELETADYQLSLFGTLSDAQQETYLLENIAEIDNGMAVRKSTGLIEAWSAADAPRIAALTEELTSGDSVSATFMEHTLLGQRNPQMAASIERIMDGGNTAFVGIGLLHLVGAHGVPALLRQHGYQVEQVY